MHLLLQVSTHTKQNTCTCVGG